jgi:hypothetical protein
MSDERIPMILLGTQSDETGKVWKIGVPLSDLTTHGLVTGTTGSGKSTFLRNLALQVFGLGASVAVIEPHGDLCLDLLSAVPDAFLDRVVYMEVDSLQPPSIPLMVVGLAAGQDVAVDAAMSVIRMAEPSAWDSATRMREVLRNVARVVLDVLGWQASLLAVDRFLSDDAEMFREYILSRVSEENIRARDFCRHEVAACLDGSKKASGMKDSILAARRRLEIFVADRHLRRTMALPPLGPSISLRQLLAGGKMVLLPVNAARLGGVSAGLVSMLFMQMAKTAFMGRITQSERRQAAIIIDEFAAMAGAETGGDEVADITSTLLAEARKFGASVILATQSVAQLPSDVAKKIQINTNLKVILMVSDPEEARHAARILGDELVSDTDIRTLPKYHGYIKARAKPPCMIKILPPQRLSAPPRRSSASEPEPPAESDLWRQIVQKAVNATNPDDPSGAREVITFLRGLSQEDWQRAVKEIQMWNQYYARRLLAHPERVPDPVERAKKISRAQYGLPWWLRDAHYWREMDAWKQKVGRPAGKSEEDFS